MRIQQDILATLTYFDLFQYPLTASEITQFLRHTWPHADVHLALQDLCAENWIFHFDDCYSLQNDPALVSRRRKGNTQARTLLLTAERVAGWLSVFPFVKGVAVSGSLSKNFADDHSDIDFFLITERNRLWIARTLLHLLKKGSFLLRREDWFCMNYFVDEEALEIREKNVYTAVEVATLLPLRGVEAFSRFFAANRWSRAFLPNHGLRVSYLRETPRPLLKRLVEALFRNPLGDILDRALMRLSLHRWAAKTRRGQRNRRGLLMGMDGGIHYAKPHPGAFQEKLVGLYEKKMVNLFRRFDTRAKSLY